MIKGSVEKFMNILEFLRDSFMSRDYDSTKALDSVSKK